MMEPLRRRKNAGNVVHVLGDTAIIVTKRGVEVRCDTADLGLLLRYTWCTNAYKGRKMYAWTSFVRADGKRVWRTMHQVLMPDAEVVDHLDRDTLNNSRANLRPANAGMNAQNRDKKSRSGYTGVYQDGKRWLAEIKVGGKRHPLGRYDTREEAARARDRATIQHFGERVFLNFPHEAPGAEGGSATP